MIKRFLGAGAALALLVGLLAVPSAQAQTVPAWCSDKSDLALLGTSADTGYATTGYNGAAPVNDGYMATTYGWTRKLRDSLAAQWNTTTTNAAHNGSLASDYLPGGRWASTTGAVAGLADEQPSITVIDLGGNEYYSQVPPATFSAQLSQIVDNLHAVRADMVILFAIYPELDRSAGVGTYGPTVSTWGTYATTIYNVAVAKGAALLDLRQTVPPATAATQPVPSPWTSDKIHLNEAGNLAEFGVYWGWVSSLWSICG